MFLNSLDGLGGRIYMAFRWFYVKHLRYINFSIWFLGSTSNFGVQFKLKSLFLKNTLEVFRDLHVNSHSTNMAHELNSCHICTKALPN